MLAELGAKIGQAPARVNLPDRTGAAVARADNQPRAKPRARPALETARD